MPAPAYNKALSPIKNAQALLVALGVTSLANTIEAALIQLIFRIQTIWTTAYTADGAISLVNGVHVIEKGSAAAMTVAAPTANDRLRLVIISNSDYAHVITFTGATLLDGTTGANLTVTMTAFKGSAITIVSRGTKWLLENASNVTSITV